MTNLTETRGKPQISSAAAITFVARYAPFLFLAILMIAFGVLEPRFLTAFNLLNVLRQVSIYGLLALGMTFVILTSGIDLSIGSIIALAGLVAATVAKGGLDERFVIGAGGYGWFAAALMAVAIGLAAGALQGLAIIKMKVPPFIVTLGGMSAFRGAALLFSDGGPVSGFDASYVWWGQGKIWFLPVPVLIFAVFAVLCHLVLRYTRYGRQVYAVGGNAEAARLAGIDVRRVLLSVYVITGFFAGLSAFVLSARLNSAEAVAGTGYELTVIASVVIGGTSLFGGIGTIAGTVVGTVLIGVLLNGLVLLSVSAYIQQILVGLIIVLAVAFDTYAKAKR